MANIFSSSIGKKLIMSISGMFLIVFMVVHLGINLLALVSQEAYNTACVFMDTNPLVQVLVPVLAAGFAIHIIYAVLITAANMKARPVAYAVSNNAEASSWAARNMFVLGAIVLGFLCLHLYNFWAKMQLEHFLTGHGHPDPYTLVKTLLSDPIYAGIYIVWIGALYLHMSHGFWSMFQSIGVNNSTWIPRLQCAAKIYAVVVCLGFISIPLCFLFGIR